MAAQEKQVKEVTLEVILNWPRAWMVRDRAPGVPVSEPEQYVFWLSKADVDRLGNVGPSHAVFRIPIYLCIEHNL